MIRSFVVSLTIALVALVAAAPAHADNELGLSSDGVHWSSALASPLFPASLHLVPGESEQSTFYVRNQGPTNGQMTINAFSTDAQHLLASGSLVIAARVGSGAWTSLRVGRTRVLPAVLKIARNATSSVTVKVTLLASTTAQMDLAAAFRLRILMFQGDVKGINTGHGGNGNGNGNGDGNGNGGGQVKGINVGNGGGLPNTGSPITMMWIWIAAGLIGSGIALVAPRRRREARDD
ncbi:hypothetical protein [Nocardioides ultimimeridianus]